MNIGGQPGARYLPITNGFSAQEFLELGIHARVNVVEGKMLQIDREKKLVALQNGTVLRYDYLIITTGLQVFLQIFYHRVFLVCQNPDVALNFVEFGQNSRRFVTFYNEISVRPHILGLAILLSVIASSFVFNTWCSPLPKQAFSNLDQPQSL